MKNKRVHTYMRDNFTEVLHTTLNPDGPGAVRIHLVPPEYDGEKLSPSIAIINGQDILPVNYSWTVLLAELIKNINRYEGRAVKDEDVSEILKNTVHGVKKVFPLIGGGRIKKDAYRIMNTFVEVAYGQEVTEDVQYMSIGEYAPYMRAPHRMDLMVSAMTVDGQWHCNQKCVHCYAAGQKHAEEKELSTDEWKKILDKCREAGIPQVTFTGGEPTMREDLFELIEYARWFVSRLNTNGIKLTKEYCEGLKKAELDNLQITFYSGDPEIHNRLVGAPQYENTLAGIRNALDCGLSLSINTPLCTLNRDYVSTLKFLHGLGVTYVTCSGIITTGNAAETESERLQLTNEEMREVLEEAVLYCASSGMEISFTSPGWISEGFFRRYRLITPNCGACLSNMAVTPAGNVVPCQSWLSGTVLGSMLTDDWEKIWNDDFCRERRAYAAEMRGECPLRKQRAEL